MADLRGNLDLLQDFWNETASLERAFHKDFDRLLDTLPEKRQVELREAHIQTQLEGLARLKRECVGRICTAASTKTSSMFPPNLFPCEAPARLKEKPQEKCSEETGSGDEASYTVKPPDAASKVDSTD